MSTKALKNNKKNKISKKTYIFWGSVASIVLFLIVSLVIFAVRNQSIVNYDGLDYLEGQEFFQQEEDSYLILFYDFKYEKEFESFDNDFYSYLEYYRDHKGKEGVLKVYGADCTTTVNKTIVVDNESDTKINGTTKHPAGVPIGTDISDPSILKIAYSKLPVLLIVTTNEETGIKEISAYKSGETDIKTYLQGLKK